MGTNVFSVIIIWTCSNLLWVLGIHGPNTVALFVTPFSLNQT
ncbi:PTS system, cellobiose-specific IIC component [Listeria monocytogenes]|nr:PTS system, cellobiose-specific IIC component [Listeria monocytogenes]